jgi:CRISPR type IV-associated protein Csf1
MEHKTVSHFVFEYGYDQSLDHMDSRSARNGEVCAYCGNPFKQMVSMSQFELARYTNWHLHKERNSKLFCLPCAFLLRTDDFRRKALIVTTEGVHFFQRKSPQDWELLTKYIFYVPPKPPFIICVPSDYRKHIVLRTKINYKQTDFHVQFGEDAIPVRPFIHKNVYETVKLLYETGTKQNQIWHKAYSGITKTPSIKLDQLEQVIAPWRHTSLLFFILEFARPMVKEE